MVKALAIHSMDIHGSINKRILGTSPKGALKRDEESCRLAAQEPPGGRMAHRATTGE